ncbi:MAG: hypothetical protein IKY52_03715 [Clostridia bacterium]|nr:hypothetical protein [Clostridia bacterium]
MDKYVSARALELRNRILDMGYPCAVSFYPYATDHLRPVLCILTFQDAIDIIRSSPLDDIPALVLGSGFINSLFQAEQFPTEDAMLARMEEILFAYLGTEKRIYAGTPVYYLKKGFSVNELQIFYRMTCLKLTEREQRILKLILYAPEEIHSFRRIEAYTFPYPYAENILNVTNTISVQISSINRKAARYTARKFLKYRREGNREGYVLEIRKIEKKTDCEQK